MQILQICQWYIPEYGFQEYFLADAWQRMGHEVVSIAGTHVYPRAGYGQIEGLARQRKVPPGQHQELDTDVWRLPCLELRHRTFLSTKLEALVRELAPDMVLVHGVTSANLLRLARLKGKTRKPFRLICDEHMLSTNTQNGITGKLFYGTFRRLVTPALLRSVDIFVPISDETQDILSRRCGIPLEMMKVIPLGVDVRRFHRNVREREAIRKQLNVAPDEVLLIYAGKLTPEKGTLALVDAALRLLSSHAHVKLLVIGSGERGLVDEQRARVRDAGLESRVAWMPLLPNAELPGYFSAADIGIWPRGPSMVMLEATACELPIVCEGTPYHTERFGNGTALLFHDFDEMLGHISRLIEDPGLRRSTGSRAREAVEVHSWDRVAARFLEV